MTFCRTLANAKAELIRGQRVEVVRGRSDSQTLNDLHSLSSEEPDASSSAASVMAVGVHAVTHPRALQAWDYANVSHPISMTARQQSILDDEEP